MVDSLEIMKERVRKETMDSWELMKERVRKESTADAFTMVVERLIRVGTDGSTIATATGYDRNRIDSIAHRLNRTVNWNSAME